MEIINQAQTAKEQKTWKDTIVSHAIEVTSALAFLILTSAVIAGTITICKYHKEIKDIGGQVCHFIAQQGENIGHFIVQQGKNIL